MTAVQKFYISYSCRLGFPLSLLQKSAAALAAVVCVTVGQWMFMSMTGMLATSTVPPQVVVKLLNSDNRAPIFVKLPIIKIYTVDFLPQEFFQLNLVWKYMKFAEKPAIVGLAGRCDHSCTLHCGTPKARY